MKLIESKTITTAQANIEFSLIPQTFTDLVVLISGRSTGSSSVGGAYAELRPNSSTSGIASRALRGLGSGSAQSQPETILLVRINPSDYTASTFCNSSVYISNYAASTNKSFSSDAVTENNATESQQSLLAGLWSNTAPITSFLLVPGSGNFASGTTVSLYGIGGAGDGWAPKATGGVISKIDGYYVHTFTASGTFTPTTNLTDVEYLVVAGGGSGGCGAGGGGGAGGYRSSVVGQLSGANSTAESRLSLTSGTSYTVTIGAGGASRSGSDANGFAGTNSTFATITSTAGGFGAGFSGPGGTGGSGGGASYNAIGGSGTANQGFAGAGASGNAGGGGGAGEAGNTDGSAFGGDGLSSNITGSLVFRGGGGAGAAGGAQPGDGGGGTSTVTSGASIIGGNGTANTGGGGGGSNGGLSTGAGGSGIVIVRYAA